MRCRGRLGTRPAKIVKINPVTMESVATLTLATGEDRCLTLSFDGTYLYAGLGTYYPAKIVRKPVVRLTY